MDNQALVTMVGSFVRL